MNVEPEVTFDFDALDSTLTITSANVVLAIHVAGSDLARLRDVHGADWDRRESLQVGTVLDQPVFWCRGLRPGTVHVLVGPDDEMWQVAVVLPDPVVQAIASTSTS